MDYIIMVYEITNSTKNKDFLGNHGKYEAKSYYLRLYGDFKSQLPQPDFYPSPERSDIFILDFAKGPCGLKAYRAEAFIARLPNKLMGYAAPRVGHAAEAIAMLTEMYDKK